MKASGMNHPPIERTIIERPEPIGTIETALGNVSEWAIQRWVAWSGKKVRILEAPWLEGPVGDEYIGAEFYRSYAREAGLEAVVDEDAGLLPDFNALAGERFDPSQVRPEIRGFYERTARYDLDVQVAWGGLFQYPPRTLIYLLGRNVGQFDIPLSTSAVAMENELIRLEDPLTAEAPYVGWLRRSAVTGEAMLAGLYTTCELPRARGRFFKGIYPLPGGSATMIFRPENRPDGSLAFLSDGRRFGEAGYYRVHRTAPGVLRVTRVPIEEAVHWSVDSEGSLNAIHTFSFLKSRFLTLRYEISRRA